jgi:hypothetical protein
MVGMVAFLACTLVSRYGDDKSFPIHANCDRSPHGRLVAMGPMVGMFVRTAYRETETTKSFLYMQKR